VGRAAFVGPRVVVVCSGGRTVRIGEGAVVGAGCVVTRSIPPRTVLVAAPARAVATASFPLALARRIEEFQRGLRPLTRAEPDPAAPIGMALGPTPCAASRDDHGSCEAGSGALGKE